MKEVKAFIKPHKLADVTLALHKIEGLTGMSVVEGRGFGRGRGKDSPHRIVENLVDYIPNVRVELVCPDELAETVVSVIEENAHTGLRGDGKIYVLPVEQAVRISTGERGDPAI